MKRIFDFTVSLSLLIILSPLIFTVGLITYFKLGSPIIFAQKRPGLNGSIFRMYKFRTMSEEKDSNGEYLNDKNRLGSFGKWMRSISLDELPELWNVLKGEMSLVGPRPLLPEYLDLYTPKQKQRHNVRPGITGWAQINGRNDITWEEKFDLDIWYVKNRSLYLDIKILLKTIKSVVNKEGISQSGEATTQKFTGTNCE